MRTSYPFDWAFDWVLHDLDVHCRFAGRLLVEHRPHALVVKRPATLVDVAGLRLHPVFTVLAELFAQRTFQWPVLSLPKRR
jgi:hypothetical protein